MPIRPGILFAIIWIGWLLSWMIAARATFTSILGAVAIVFGLWIKARVEERLLTTNLVPTLTAIIDAACRCWCRSGPASGSVSARPRESGDPVILGIKLDSRWSLYSGRRSRDPVRE
jgi:hypothetical protein